MPDYLLLDFLASLIYSLHMLILLGCAVIFACGFLAGYSYGYVHGFEEEFSSEMERRWK